MKTIYKKDGIQIGDEFLSLTDIIKNCNEVKVKDENLVLFKMEWGSRRGFDGILEEIVLPKKNVEIIKKHIIGKEIYFGEIAGKHSEIYGKLEESETKVIEDPEKIEDFLRKNPSGHSYNHSFLYTYSDYANDGGYGEVNEKEMKEFDGAF